jgi:hypothetical protein
VTHLRITNPERTSQVWFAPDQITLIYLTPALEHQKPGAGGWTCTTGYCEKSPDLGHGGDTREANTIRSGETVRWPFAFLIPDGANGFRLLLRTAIVVRGVSQRQQQSVLVNLSCC